jgi:hypothetical protein
MLFLRCRRWFAHSTFGILLLLSVACEDEPVVFGNDGAVLPKVNLSGAIALAAFDEATTRYEDANGMTYPRVQLYKMTVGGVFSLIDYTFDGSPNGGTENYVPYYLNDEYFILTFPLRMESYIIEKATGNATKTVYLGFPADVVASESDLYYHDMAFLNTMHLSRAAVVKNYLTGSPEETELPGDIGQIFFDKNGRVYHRGVESVYYYDEGINEEIAPTTLSAWNDHEGILHILRPDGTRATVLDGVITEEDALQNIEIHSATNTFQPFAFPEQSRTIAYIRTKELDHIIYDLSANKAILNLNNEIDGYMFTAISQADRYLYLLFTGANDMKIVRVDVINNFTSTMNVPPSDTSFDGFQAINTDEFLFVLCDFSATNIPGACYRRMKYYNSNGTYITVASEYSPSYFGTMIRL